MKCVYVCVWGLSGHIWLIWEQAVKIELGYPRKTTTAMPHFYCVKYNLRDAVLDVQTFCECKRSLERFYSSWHAGS